MIASAAPSLARVGIAALAVAAALAVPAVGEAHGGRVGVGVYVGPPAVYYRPGPGPYWYGPRYYGPRYYGPRVYGPYAYGWPYAYPAPVYVYPPVTVAPAAPPVYVERDEPAARAPLEAGFWYFCRNPEGYYPTVRECPGGWEKVPPRPPGAQ